MINRNELEKKVPRGYKTVIAKRAGVTLQCVSNYFAGKTNNERVEIATLEVLAEMSTAKKSLLAMIM